MSEDALMQLLSSRWTAAIVAYALGILTGWVIWASSGSDDEPKRREPAESGEDDGEMEPHIVRPEPSPGVRQRDADPQKVEALEMELKKAKSLLENAASEREKIEGEISILDSAVKRANGRLKLIVKSIKRGK